MFGLNFTYHFQMPWEDQISHAKVAEMRTVGGSRHEFVDRENRIILEYRAKKAYMIEYLGPNGSAVNEFVFRIKNGFGEFKAGQTVRVTASGVTLAEATAPAKSFLAQAGEFIGGLFGVSEAHAADFSQTYITDAQGRFIVRVNSATTGSVTLHIQAGDNTQSFTLNVVANLTWELDHVSGSGTLTQGSPGSLTLTLTQGGVAKPGITVSFTPNPNVSGLPGSATTDANGQITLSGLTLLTPTDQTIVANIDGQKLNIQVTVIPGTYTLEATPDALTQFAATNVTFMVKQGGIVVPVGTAVTFTANSNFANLPTAEQTTNASGQITVTGLNATVSGSQTIQATVDGQTVSVPITVSATTTEITFQPTSGGGVFTDYNGTTATFSVQVQENGVDVADGTTVTWNVQSSDISRNLAVATDIDRSFNGLTLGGTIVTGAITTATSTTSSGVASITLTDILGERDVTVQAQVTIGGVNKAETSSSFTFGKGPLSNFKLGYPGNPNTSVNWDTAITACGGSFSGPFTSTATYYPGTNLPDVDMPIATANYTTMRTAAGVPSAYVWTGRALLDSGGGRASIVRLVNSELGSSQVGNNYRVLCACP